MAKSRDILEWIEFYEKKTKEKFHLEEGEQIRWDPEKGFMTYGLSKYEDALAIGKMCGDGKFWEAIANEMCKQLGFKKAIYFTKRNPHAFIRRYGGKIYGFYLEREVR